MGGEEPPRKAKDEGVDVMEGTGAAATEVDGDYAKDNSNDKEVAAVQGTAAVLHDESSEGSGIWPDSIWTRTDATEAKAMEVDCACLQTKERGKTKRGIKCTGKKTDADGSGAKEEARQSAGACGKEEGTSGRQKEMEEAVDGRRKASE